MSILTTGSPQFEASLDKAIDKMMSLSERLHEWALEEPNPDQYPEYVELTEEYDATMAAYEDLVNPERVWPKAVPASTPFIPDAFRCLTK